jgi:hypothetical protein
MNGDGVASVVMLVIMVVVLMMCGGGGGVVSNNKKTVNEYVHITPEGGCKKLNSNI